MKTKTDDRLDSDNDTPANDNRESARQVPVTTAAMGSTALTSLTELGAVLNTVDTNSGASSSGHPILLFKARESDGTWWFGRQQTVVEAGSRWAVNPKTFYRGYICFGEGNKKLDERMLSVSLPMIDPTTLPDKGYPWKEQWAVNLKCLDGTDIGVEVTFKTNTYGGIQAVRDILLGTIRDRINGGQHGGKVSPIALLEKADYTNDYGKQWNPVFNIVDWMLLDGPAPAPAAPSSPAGASEQPRRRRVGG